MSPNRREFLSRLGLTVAAAAMGKVSESVAHTPPPSYDEWDQVRQSFILDPSFIHMSGMLFASHPKPVRDAIERHRRGFDANPVHYVHNNDEGRPRSAAARYLDTEYSNIALTDSTTMGIGLVYGGLKLSSSDEILTTTHDHAVTESALSFLSKRTGATIKRVSLYSNSASASESEMVDRLKAGISTRTKLVAITWVHSCSGVKTPVSRIADEIDRVNRSRGTADQILFCVDGVHGFGIENVTMSELNCDFFMAGTHKWLHGPRGTGIICSRSSSTWSNVSSIIPSFSGGSDGYRMTPGGFHSFEHRWALAEAFEFHMAIGKAKVEKRIHDLNTQMKEGLRKISGVTVHTPMSETISSGIICFSVSGYSPYGVVQALANKRIIATESPYAISYARVTPGILNTPQEVDKTIAAVASM